MVSDIVTILVIFMSLQTEDFTSLRNGFLYSKLGVSVAFIGPGIHAVYMLIIIY